MNTKFNFSNKNILIIGGSGSLGISLIKNFVNENQVTIASRDEAKHWTLRNEFKKNKNLIFKIGDIRDKNRIQEIILDSQPNIIIIAAALKQVDTCENVPIESVKTNLLGIQNVVDVIKLNINNLVKLETTLLVSTDKACAPTNVYGMCKAISERIVTNTICENKNVKFIGVRYGNVLESRGSIIPLFKYQVEQKSNLTITHKEMTRFVMTLQESCDLIKTAISLADSGEIYVPKLPSMKIMDLATIFANRYKSKIDFIGMRAGEKLHEQLISETESFRVSENGENYVIKSSLYSNLTRDTDFSYSSNTSSLNISELESYLDELGIFEMRLNDFVGKSIDEIRKD